MNRRLRLVIALLVLAALLPPAALATKATPKGHHHGTNCNAGSASAVCVYIEGARGPGGSRPLGTGAGKGQPLSKYAMSQLERYGGKDQRVLETVAISPAYLPTHFGHAAAGGGSSSPGGLLSALDLGTGPLALFATLLAGAVAIAGSRALRRHRAAR